VKGVHRKALGITQQIRKVVPTRSCGLLAGTTDLSFFLPFFLPSFFPSKEDPSEMKSGEICPLSYALSNCLIRR
jgi:hypothetical protein